MPKYIECANCGKEITGDVYMFLDNFLQVKYFDDNKSNRFCSQDCACEALFLRQVEQEEIPLDDDEESEDDDA